MSEVLERPTTTEVANALVAMWKAGRFDESGETYWADDVVSYENMPGNEMAEIRSGVMPQENAVTGRHIHSLPAPRRACEKSTYA